MIKNLIYVANNLDDLGLTKEADLLDQIIYKIARKYVKTVVDEGLSGGFFAVVNEIQEDIWNWNSIVSSYTKPIIKKYYPDLDDKLIDIHISTCLYERGKKYSRSINASDPGINPWIFSFLTDFTLPFINTSFSKAIENLPADYSTKSELKELLSLPLIHQQGVNSIADVLDGDVESYLICIQNIIHEVHHNIINHSAWKRFMKLGPDNSKYNLLDALDEGIADSLLNIHNDSRIEDAYKTFTVGMSNFMFPILKNIILDDDNDAVNYNSIVGDKFLNNWKKLYDHLDLALREDSGIQSKEYKILFIQKVLKDLKPSISQNSTLSDIDKYLKNSILNTWNNTISKDKDVLWDFLTNDDENLLIDLMKDLDNRSEELSTAWKAYKSKYIQQDSDFVLKCIESNNYLN